VRRLLEVLILFLRDSAGRLRGFWTPVLIGLPMRCGALLKTRSSAVIMGLSSILMVASRGILRIDRVAGLSVSTFPVEERKGIIWM
jgi:hypothetical protein